MDRAGRRVAKARVAVVVAGAALGLASCAPSPDWKAAQASEGLEGYYAQDLDWTGCDRDQAFSTGVDVLDEWIGLDDLECAWLTVPLDYDDPAGETIKIAVGRSAAEHSQGSLVVNPGGPGGSGFELVPSVLENGGSKLVDALDIVAFDPRGVGRSAPIDCLDDADLDVYLSSDVDTTTAEGLAQAKAVEAEFGAGCLERTGPLLAHVDTISAARDMDVLRAALGESTLTYLGISYGTKLGATYAELFPEQVGRLVLDGAVDLTATPGEKMVLQAGGFESALRAYVEDCLGGDDCPLSGSVDEAMAQVVDVVEQARANPMSVGGRQVNGALALTGIMAALYSQDSWEYLTMGLKGAIDEQNGGVLLFLADSYVGRCDGYTCPVTDGYYSNLMEAFTAISCVDARRDMDPATVAAELEQTKQVAPTLWPYFKAELDGCADWPVPLVGPLPSYTAEGALPIVVVGTTNDPATPYSGAQKLAEMLDSGVLVTYEGEGHAAYIGGPECIQTAVDDFLVDGKVPEDGLTCSAR